MNCLGDWRSVVKTGMTLRGSIKPGTYFRLNKMEAVRPYHGLSYSYSNVLSRVLDKFTFVAEKLTTILSLRTTVYIAM